MSGSEEGALKEKLLVWLLLDKIVEKFRSVADKKTKAAVKKATAEKHAKIEDALESFLAGRSAVQKAMAEAASEKSVTKKTVIGFAPETTVEIPPKCV